MIVTYSSSLIENDGYHKENETALHVAIEFIRNYICESETEIIDM